MVHTPLGQRILEQLCESDHLRSDHLLLCRTQRLLHITNRNKYHHLLLGQVIRHAVLRESEERVVDSIAMNNLQSTQSVSHRDEYWDITWSFAC